MPGFPGQCAGGCGVQTEPLPLVFCRHQQWLTGEVLFSPSWSHAGQLSGVSGSLCEVSLHFLPLSHYTVRPDWEHPTREEKKAQNIVLEMTLIDSPGQVNVGVTTVQTMMIII